MSDYRKLRVWIAADALAGELLDLAPRMSRSDLRELRDQLIRAAISVPANIVEGSAYASRREFARFLQYAAGSAAELEQHIGIAYKRGVLSDSDLERLTDKVKSIRKMLQALRRRVISTNDQ
jgi:four helix bundle protein